MRLSLKNRVGDRGLRDNARDWKFTASPSLPFPSYSRHDILDFDKRCKRFDPATIIGKNKKVRERCALLRMAIDGERKPAFNPDWEFERGRIEGDDQTGEEVDANGALIVRINEDLDVPDVDTRQLPKPRSSHTKT